MIFSELTIIGHVVVKERHWALTSGDLVEGKTDVLSNGQFAFHWLRPEMEMSDDDDDDDYDEDDDDEDNVD